MHSFRLSGATVDELRWKFASELCRSGVPTFPQFACECQNKRHLGSLGWLRGIIATSGDRDVAILILIWRIFAGNDVVGILRVQIKSRNCLIALIELHAAVTYVL